MQQIHINLLFVKNIYDNRSYIHVSVKVSKMINGGGGR